MNFGALRASGDKLRLAGVLLVAAWGLPAAADTVVLRNGTERTGIIRAQDPRTGAVTLATSAGEITIPGDRILEIRRDTPAQGHVRLGDQFLENRQFERAIEEYRKALELEPDDPSIATKVSLAEAGMAEERLTQAAAEADRQRRLVAEALSLSGRGQHGQAVEVLRPMALLGANMPTQARAALVDINIAWARERMDRQDPGGASEKLQAALRLDPSNETALEMLTRAWEGDPSRINEVIEALEASNRPEDRIRLADAYFRRRDYEKALPVYQELLQNPESASEAVRERTRLIFDILHRRFAEQGDFQRAFETYQAFMEFDPTVDPAPFFRYQYMVLKSQTPVDDIDARVRLAQFANQVGLSEVARQEFINLHRASPQTTGVIEGLASFANADLRMAQEFFNTGQFNMALVVAQRVANEFSMLPQAARQASEMAARAQVEQRRQVQDMQANAERLAQRGDQYYQQAQGFLEMYISTDRNTQIRVINPRWEAVRMFDMAITTWREALRIDPNLASVTSFDLNRKIADAERKRASLANTRPPTFGRFPTTVRLAPAD
jgi:tetratricopeptide (TPR) repeat protein